MDESNPYAEKMFASNKVFDEKAFTVKEISIAMGISYSRAGQIARAKAEIGEWEQVFKHGDRCAVPAYRPKP